MTEIFENIPEFVKENAKSAFELAMHFHNPIQIANFLNEYTNSCQDEEEKEFVEFYFKMRMAELLK